MIYAECIDKLVKNGKINDASLVADMNVHGEIKGVEGGIFAYTKAQSIATIGRFYAPVKQAG